MRVAIDITSRISRADSCYRSHQVMTRLLLTDPGGGGSKLWVGVGAQAGTTAHFWTQNMQQKCRNGGKKVLIFLLRLLAVRRFFATVSDPVLPRQALSSPVIVFWPKVGPQNTHSGTDLLPSEGVVGYH